MIPFNKAVYLKTSEEYVEETLRNSKIAGDGKYTKLCSRWMEDKFQASKILMTTSCTAALEMCAILLDIYPGDEVIMPSYTFVTTANAFVLRGAKIVFVDIRPDTMNIDEKKIEEAITKKTKAIVVVHYAGVSCEMEYILKVSEKYNIPVVEDAAQGVMATYKGKALGTIGTLGCYSFHETKNYTMGEGGALVINNEAFVERAEILREKGTNRSRFFRGMVDKYSWVDIGSSYLPSEINAAFLYGQLEVADGINESRIRLWENYFKKLQGLPLDLPKIPEGCCHNAHMFYIKVGNLQERQKVIAYLTQHDISAVFHYVPLHSSQAGLTYSRFSGKDCFTTVESERLIRLPLWYGMSTEEQGKVIQTVCDYFR